MISNLKIYQCGSYVVFNGISLKTSSNIKAQLRKRDNDIKLTNHLIRAKNTIQQLALCNDFKYFVTFTVKPTFDRKHLDNIRLAFKYVCKIIRKQFNIDFKYLIVPEQHKDGSWHLHGFFTESIKDALFINDYGFWEIWGFDYLGWHNIQVIQSLEKCANYVTKYISKNIGKGVKKFKHSYFSSIGLKRPELVADLLYDNEFFNANFFDYKNDYCMKKIIKDFNYKNVVNLLTDKNHISKI